MKNKKTIIFLFIYFIVCGFIMFSLNHSVELQNNACKSIGFEGYKFINETELCIDSDENLHYIETNHESSLLGFWDNEYTAKQIKVGEVYEVVE